MKHKLLLSLLLVMSVPVMAQQTPVPPNPIDPPIPPEPASIVEVEHKLTEAKRRMEEAAREVAEYSSQLYSNHAPQVLRFNYSLGNGKGAMIGVAIDGSTDASGNRLDGVNVMQVTPNGPADKAGIKAGDRIVAINGENLQWQDGSSPAKQMLDLMAKVEPEASVTVDYERDGEAKSIVVKTENLGAHRLFAGEPFDFDIKFDLKDFERSKQALQDDMIVLKDRINNMSFGFRQPWHKLELMKLSPKLGSYFNTEKGVLVVSTGEDVNLPLEEGDVILNIDGREPNDPSHTMRILGSYRPGEKVTLEIMRDRRKRTVDFTVEDFNKDVGYQWYFPDDSNLNLHLVPGTRGHGAKVIKLNKESSI